MRSTLCLATVVVTRYNQVIRLYYQRLPEAGKNQKVALTVLGSRHPPTPPDYQSPRSRPQTN